MKISVKFALHFLLFVTLCITAYSQAVTETTKLSGIKDIVSVTRDARWIPYIEAKSDQDAYFAQGFITASDRLWQMDLLRRVARGETAEIFGKTTLEEDKRWRTFGFAKIAEQSIKYLEPDLRQALDDYARGVNAYIATLDKDTLPIEFRILQYQPREWTSADSIIIGKILADALSSTYSGDLLRESLKDIDPAKYTDLTNKVTPYDVILFGKDVAAKTAINSALQIDKIIGEKSPNGDEIRSFLENDRVLRERSLSRVGLYAEGLAASNNWVISGKRTADGKPILANDPHLMPSAPGIWYLTHLSTPGMRVAGVTFPGVPGIVLGHNEHIAWGATNVGPDVQDLYREQIDVIHGLKARGKDDEDKVVRKRDEIIRVRTSPLKPETEEVIFPVLETDIGPIVINEQGGKWYSLRWTAFDPKNSDFGAFYLLNRVRDWEGFKKALSSYGGATQNFVYADTKGNIGWHVAGKIPVRRKGDGSLPYDAWTNDGDWTGFIPFAELPNLYNPPEGFIMTANQRIVGTDYKHQQLVRDFAAPWRARRLHDLLSKDTKATMDSTSAAQHDVYNIPLKMLADDIVRLKAANDGLLKDISEWNGEMTPDSKAALAVNEIRNCAAEKLSAADKRIPAYLIRERILYRAVRENSALWLPKEFGDYGELLRSCSDGLDASLSQRYGKDREKWVWGAVSTSRFPHPLAVAPLIGGQFATPRVSISGSGQTPNVASAVSMRHIASPGNWDATRFVIPLGQSGDPKSPYYKDQFDLWKDGTPAVFPFSEEAINKAAVKTVKYEPVSTP
ncbi:MAG: penicillin acylase family protein [Acidobacteria bacterium]|nr:penicillin acylase family protein [Acidobacteriota bacterium]